MNTKSKIESLLFLSGNPFSADKMSGVLKLKKEETLAALEELKKEYDEAERGMRIAVIENKYQMVTAPEASEVVQDFLKEEVLGELTKPQLESLTVIAYRGPISKFELEQIRGVNCTMILRNLMIRGLIEMKPIDGAEKYLITHDFMKYLGLADLKNLPDYDALNANANLQDLMTRSQEGDKK